MAHRIPVAYARTGTSAAMRISRQLKGASPDLYQSFLAGTNA